MHLERPVLAAVVAAAAVVALVLLDRLRRQPVVLLVASLELFPETAEVRESSARSRRHEWRELFLRALAALAFAFAVGGPSLAGGARAGRRVRIVLDRGASLGAREPSGRTRLDLARDEVRRALERLAPEDTVDLAFVPRGEDEPPAGLSPSQASRALEGVRAVAAPGDLADAAAILGAAASDLARDPGRALPALLVTDREPGELGAKARVALVGTPLRNRAIVGLGTSRDSGRERLLVAVANLSDEPARVVLDLLLPAKLERTLDLAANATGSVVIDDPLVGQASRVEVALRGSDALATDDRAVAVRSVDAPVRIALAGDLGRSVEKALRACEGALVELFPGETPLRGFDITVARVTRDDEPAPSEGALVAVYPPREGREVRPKRFAVTPNARALALSVGEGDEQALARALSGIAVRGEPPSNLGELAPVVVAEGGVPAIAWRPGVVYLGFDTAAIEDGWARDASFPRFWAEIVERARERPDRPATLEAHETGRSLLLPRPLDALAQQPLEVVLPSGEKRRPRGRFVPLETGVHRVHAPPGKAEATFAAALLDPVASDLRGARTRPWDDATLALLARRDESGARLALAPFAAVLGLVFALAAWALAARRGDERA